MIFSLPLIYSGGGFSFSESVTLFYFTAILDLTICKGAAPSPAGDGRRNAEGGVPNKLTGAAISCCFSGALDAKLGAGGTPPAGDGGRAPAESRGRASGGSRAEPLQMVKAEPYRRQVLTIGDTMLYNLIIVNLIGDRQYD